MTRRWSTGAQWGPPPVIHGEPWWAWTVVAILVACLAISLIWVGWMTLRRHEDALM